MREQNFIIQQGYSVPAGQGCSVRYGALQFQPRVVGLLFLAGWVFQAPGLFLGLSALLWLGALLPAWNLFEVLYNRTGFRRAYGGEPLQPAPAPRRFAQGMAATFTLSIALCL